MVERELAESELVYAEVEVLGPEEQPVAEQPGLHPHMAELLDMLVSRFEDSLLARDDQIDALEQQLHETQQRASSDADELATTQHVLRILERENTRLTAEVELLRGHVAELAHVRAQLAELEELRQQVATLKKRRRLAMELDALRRQVSELSFSSDRVLEQLLGQQEYR